MGNSGQGGGGAPGEVRGYWNPVRTVAPSSGQEGNSHSLWRVVPSGKIEQLSPFQLAWHLLLVRPNWEPET